MKIAVIGSGWLGLPLAERLRERGNDVFSTKRSVSAETAPEIKQFPSADNSTEQLLGEADVVILAFPPARTSPEAYSEDCLNCVKPLQAKCRVLMISSTSVYPDNSQLSDETSVEWTENTENRIALAEKRLHDLLGERLTILRLAGLIGPGRYPASAMSKSGKTYLADEPVNLIHLEDAVGLAEHLVVNNISGTVVNGCAKEHPLKGPYYTRMAEQLGIQPPLLEKGVAPGKIVSSERSRELGYSYLYDDPYDFLKKLQDSNFIA